MAFIIGDGDNVALVKGQTYGWMQERVSKCTADQSRKSCFPLVWTLSPSLLHMAPDMVRWFYNQSHSTKNDYFVLPPSGHLYSYPSMMRDADQAMYVQRTEQDSWIMNTSGTVSWEFIGSWSKAINTYFPRYGDRVIVKSLYAVNVPFMIPTGVFLPGEHYKVLGGKTVLFAPNEWRGERSNEKDHKMNDQLSAKEMAAKINGFPKGTVSHIYMTQDGGATLNTFYDLVPLLDEHVEIVNHNVIADMAMEREHSLGNIGPAHGLFV
jgi:hypothetical protein